MSNDELLLKKQYYNKVKYDNYLHSLRLEGFAVTEDSPDPRTLSQLERRQLLWEILERYRAANKDGTAKRPSA